MGSVYRWPDALYDKRNDPGQKNSLSDPELPGIMTAKLSAALHAAGVTDWQYVRLGLKE